MNDEMEIKIVDYFYDSKDTIIGAISIMAREGWSLVSEPKFEAMLVPFEDNPHVQIPKVFAQVWFQRPKP